MAQRKSQERQRFNEDPYRDFNGDTGIYTVLVVEVDAIDVKPLQAGLASCPHVGRIAPDLPLPVRQAEPELGRQLHLLSHPSLQCLLKIDTKITIRKPTKLCTK